MTNIHQIAQKTTGELPETTCTQPFGEGCDVYKVFNKVYLLAFHLNGQAVLNIKIEPQHGEMLRDFYSFIHTGYHMNKRHWISLYEHEEVNEDFVKDLIQSSYELVVSKLSKEERLRIEVLKSI